MSHVWELQCAAGRAAHSKENGMGLGAQSNRYSTWRRKAPRNQQTNLPCANFMCRLHSGLQSIPSNSIHPSTAHFLILSKRSISFKEKRNSSPHQEAPMQRITPALENCRHITTKLLLFQPAPFTTRTSAISVTNTAQLSLTAQLPWTALTPRRNCRHHSQRGGGPPPPAR